MLERTIPKWAAFVVAVAVSGSAQATFHLWSITQLFSNQDGTVQFIEMTALTGGQQFLTGHTVTSTQGATTHTFTFTTDLPADTTGRSLVIGTQGFAALGVVAPDFVVPNGFLFTTNGTVNWGGGFDIFTYASMPTDGSLALNRNGTTSINSPRNFAGQTGTVIPPTAPGAPTIGTATAGNARATISFSAPASNGGSPITGYTATCNPGAVTASGAGSPLTVTGLANGTSYVCSVTATNGVGTSAASAAASVTPSFNSFSAPSATGTGIVTASFTGGGAACTFTTAQLIPVTGNAASPPAGSAPAGVIFTHGLFNFTTGGCAPGGTIAMTITWPAALPVGTQYWKYGPAPGNATPHWYVLPAAIVGNVTTFSITDGALGDDDLVANGTIVDQGGPGVGAGSNATDVPTMSEWAMIALILLLGWLGARRMRKT
jgi:hypothetical protein